MEGNGYRLLLIGPLDSVHLRRLIIHLREARPEAVICALTWSMKSPLPDDVSKALDSYEVAKAPAGLLSRIPVLRSTVARIRYRRAFRTLVSSRSFECFNIHYPSPRDLHLVPLMKRTGGKVILSPWGSDVLRITDSVSLQKLKRLYSEADHITGIKGRFMDSVVSILGFDTGKIIEAGFGSDTLDYIFEHGSDVSKEQAKETFGLAGKYLITCGYNGSAGQRHEAVIKAVASVKDRLPDNLTLVFPFTYGAKAGYRQELDACLEKNGLKGFFVTDFLSLDRLLSLRKCTDMFIHVQPTDASASSVKEYLVCGAKVLNAGWIVYDDLGENAGQFIFTVPSMEALPGTIEYAYGSEEPVVPESVMSTIRSGGWKSRILDWDSMFRSLTV